MVDSKRRRPGRPGRRLEPSERLYRRRPGPGGSPRLHHRTQRQPRAVDHTLDARLAQDIPIPGLKEHRLQVTLDIVNVLNLINNDWGKLYYVRNQNDTP